MRAIKKDPGKGKKVLQSIPIPGWLFTLVTVVYCEVLLHLWTMNDFSLGRFAAVVLFALGFGGLLGQIAGFIGHRTWGKWVTAALAAVVSVFYIVEYFVNDAYQSFMPMRMLLGGAKGVTTDFGDVVVSLVLNDLWRILVMLLPALLLVAGYLINCFVSSALLHKLCHIKRREAMLACSPAGATDMALISGDMGVTSPDLNVLQIVRMVSAITIFPQIIHAIVPLLP